MHFVLNHAAAHMLSVHRQWERLSKLSLLMSTGSSVTAEHQGPQRQGQILQQLDGQRDGAGGGTHK